MAFVTESARFGSFKENRVGPGTYFHEEALKKKIDSWALLRYQQNPFGSNKEREANVLLPKPPKEEIAAVIPSPDSSRERPPRFVVPSAAFAVPLKPKDMGESTTKERGDSPGPGAYEIPSFTQKLKQKVVTKIVSKPQQADTVVQFEEVGDWFRLKSGSTDSLPIFKSHSGHSKSTRLLKEPARLLTDSSSQEGVVKLVDLGTFQKQNSQQNMSFTRSKNESVVSQLQTHRGTVQWKYENDKVERGDCLVNQEATDPQLYEPKTYRPRYKDGPSASFRSDTKKYQPVIPWKKLGLKEKLRQSPGPGSYEAHGLSVDVYKKNRVHLPPKSQLKWHPVVVRDTVEFGEASTFIPRLQLPEGGKEIGGKGNRFEGFNYYAPKASNRRIRAPVQQGPVSLVLSSSSRQEQSSDKQLDEVETQPEVKSTKIIKGTVNKVSKPGLTESQVPTPGPGTYDLAKGFIKKPPGIYGSERLLGSSGDGPQLTYTQAVVTELVESAKKQRSELRESLIRQRIEQLKAVEHKSNSALAARMSQAKQRREAPRIVLVSEYDRSKEDISSLSSGRDGRKPAFSKAGRFDEYERIRRFKATPAPGEYHQWQDWSIGTHNVKFFPK